MAASARSMVTMSPACSSDSRLNTAWPVREVWPSNTDAPGAPGTTDPSYQPTACASAGTCTKPFGVSPSEPTSADTAMAGISKCVGPSSPVVTAKTRATARVLTDSSPDDDDAGLFPSAAVAADATT